MPSDVSCVADEAQLSTHDGQAPVDLGSRTKTAMIVVMEALSEVDGHVQQSAETSARPYVRALPYGKLSTTVSLSSVGQL